MGDFNVTNLKTTLLSFNLADNPGFAAGSVYTHRFTLTFHVHVIVYTRAVAIK